MLFIFVFLKYIDNNNFKILKYIKIIFKIKTV